MKYMKLGKPFICSPVVGTTSVKYVEDIKLSDDEISALEAPYVAHTKQHAF